MSVAPLVWRGRFGHALREYSPAAAVFVLGLVLWEGIVQLLRIQFFLLPAPSAIARVFAARWPLLLDYGLFTFREALGGFLLGCGLGVAVAVLALRFRPLAAVLVPFAVASSAVPIIALSPLAIVWFGIGPSSKIAVVAVICFFPTMISTYRGLIAASPASLELMRSYATSEREVFLKLRLPTSLPFMFNAFKLSASLSMIGAVVAEFFGGSITSLGVYIKNQAGLLRTREAWSAIIVACVLGLVFYLVIQIIERVLIPWHVSYRTK